MTAGRQPGPAGLVVSAYASDFRARMWLTPDEVDDSAGLARSVARLDGVARDLLDTLVLAVGPGEHIPERFRQSVDEDGEALLLGGLLVPRAAPSEGSSIDPRYYTGVCRVNSALRGHVVAPDLPRTAEGQPSSPAHDARWDAIIVAAALELEPPRIAKSGALRKDHLARLIRRLGGETHRWTLALSVAQSTGLARSAAGALHGFPESKPRPLTHPVGLMDDPGTAAAAGLMLRLVEQDWVRVDDVSDWLRTRAPQALTARRGRRPRWEEREGLWLAEAADALHRLGAVDAQRDASGVVAIRRPSARPELPPGFILTPDRDILVPPWGLPGPEYGRLCRAAPYADGDTLYRHKLVRTGAAADLACGYDDLLPWLTSRSHSGMPTGVAQAIRGWLEAAARVTFYTGVTIYEDPGAEQRFRVGDVSDDAEARVLDYRGQAPACFSMQGDIIRVPFGQDALTVRSLVCKVGTKLPPDAEGWRWTLAPQDVGDPERFLDELRRYHEGELPGALVAALAAQADDAELAVHMSPAQLLVLPLSLANALRRDHVAGPLLQPAGPLERALVLDADLGQLRERLDALGVVVVDGGA